MISKKSKKNTLSDKISDILKAPDLHDPEDDIYDETKAKTVEADSDFENDDGLDNVLSNFRKQNAQLLQDVDKKYSGKTVSRKSLGLEADESDESEVKSHEDHSTDGEFDEFAGSFVKTKASQEENSENGSIKSDSEANLSGDSDNESNEDEEDELSGTEGSEDDFDEDGDVGITDFENSTSKEEKSNFKHVSGANASEAVQKGNAVRQQLHVWEKLMEMRIHSQKVLLSANKLPRHDEFSDFVTQSEPEFSSKIQESKKLLSNLLNKFLDVQQLLLKKYPETKDLTKSEDNNKSANGMDEEIPSDTEDEIEDKSDEEEVVPSKKRKISEFPKILSEQHQSYTNYRNGVIQKWHDKVRVASGVINKNVSASSLIKHIEHVLDDKERLRKRSQLKRSKYDILTLNKSEEPNEDTKQNGEESGDIEHKKHEEEYDTEIFDDDDFYHQLLRELIEYKTANVSDPVQLSKQWIELQQLRNKMKRKIDTKATKGRRIRYTVHSKLVNFMAPEENSTWTDEAKDELFGSVFGRKTKT